MSSPIDSSTASSAEIALDRHAPGASGLFVCGVEPLSLIDFPGNVCATLFVSGCNFRCPYCHNRSLVVESPPALDPSEVVGLLKSRAHVLDAVCITGGEPTLHRGLEQFITEVKELGLKIKLDTNGTNPGTLFRLMDAGLVDYVAVDVKAPMERYGEIVRIPSELAGSLNPAELVASTVQEVMASRVEYELRTTVCPSLIDIGDLLQMGRWLRGAERYVLQQYVYTPAVLDPATAGTAQYPASWFARAAQSLSGYFSEVLVRGV